MIQVGDRDDAELAVVREIQEEKCERDGVRSAREADEHARARRTEPVLPDRPPDLLV